MASAMRSSVFALARHDGVVCDASEMNPIVGIRYHKVGEDHDLCEQEFLKLSPQEKALYERIDFPGAAPVRIAVHFGTCCDATGANPLIGVRFHKVGEDYDVCESAFTQLVPSWQMQYERIETLGAAPIRVVDHPGITCDASGQCPIVGLRFHKIGHDWDLCELEFKKLNRQEQGEYELIPTPGAVPIPCLLPGGVSHTSRGLPAIPSSTLPSSGYATNPAGPSIPKQCALPLITFGEATTLPISVKKCDIQVLVAASVQHCMVRLSMSICNERAHAAVAAKLRFPLPPGSTVCGLTFEKEGQHFPATPVPKKKAQEVVYAEKEKGRDVAVAKEVQGNVFEMEVHPLPHQQIRKCVLTYLQPFQTADLIQLPFGFAEPLAVTCSCSSFPPLPAGASWVDSIGGRASQLDSAITIKPSQDVIFPPGGGTVSGASFGGTHFCCFIPRDEVDQLLGTCSNLTEAGMKHVAVLWDSSGSAEGANAEAACGLLQAFAASGSKTFSVYSFAVQLRAVVSAGSLESACAALRSVQYDGGTDLQCCLDEFESSLSGADNDVDGVLLFSDGLDSLKRTPRLTKEQPLLRAPIHCIATATPADTNLLQAIARSTGGHCCLTWPADASALCAKIRGSGSAPFVAALQTDQDDQAFMQEESDGFSCVPDHRLVRTAWPVEESGVMVCARFDGSHAQNVSELRVQLQAGSKRAEKIFRLQQAAPTCQLPAGCDDLAGLLFCLAAMKEQRLLGHDESFSKAVLEELSSRYCVASSASDLLLLYEPAQFLEHGIQCPPSHPAHLPWKQQKQTIDRAKQSTGLGDAERVAYVDDDGDSMRFEFLDGKLIKFVNGRMKCGDADFSGVVTSLRWENMEGWGGKVYDQHDFGGAVPEEALRTLCELANKAGINHNIPGLPTPEDSKLVGGQKTSEELNEVVALSKKLGEYLKDPMAFVGRGGGKGGGKGGGGGWGARQMEMQMESASFGAAGGAGGAWGADEDCCGDAGGWSDDEMAAPRMACNAMAMEVEDYVPRSLAPAPRSLRCAAPRGRQASGGGGGEEAGGSGGPTTDLEAYVKGVEAQYMPKLRSAIDNGCWEPAYFELRKTYGKSPSFFIFTAQLLRDGPELPAGTVARVLTNCLELGVQDVQMFRSVGYGLLAGGMPDLAVRVFERVLDLEASEPQSHLDLALSRFYLLTSGAVQSSSQNSELRSAADALVAVLRTRWADRFKEVEWPALILLRGLRAWGLGKSLGDCWPSVEPKLKFPAEVEKQCKEVLALDKPVGLLVWMAWDTDKTDVDLHIVEPSGNEVYYSNNRSSIGGHLSKDFTQGYGPEVYLLQSPVPGSYKVRAKYYASHQASASTGTTSVIIWSFTNLGGAPGTGQADFRTVRLETNKEMQDVLRIDVSDPWFGARKVTFTKM